MIDTKFLNELSTNSPAPGGGSVAALAGSLGAALSSMVAALTHEKKVCLIVNHLWIRWLEAQQLKDRLAVLVEEDTQAFNKVMEANRLPATTDEEKYKKRKFR